RSAERCVGWAWPRARSPISAVWRRLRGPERSSPEHAGPSTPYSRKTTTKRPDEPERTAVTASNEYQYDPSGSPRDRSLRAGDKDRDAVSEILRQAHVEGRLDNDEFQARLERCLKAKTYTDLDGLITDFPREGADARPIRQHARWRPWPAPFLLLPLAVIAAVGF